MSNLQFIFTPRSNVSLPYSAEAIWDPEYSFTSDAKVNWQETPKAHVFKVDAPGFKKEELKVDIEGGGQVLRISGERSPEQEEENAAWHIKERSSGKFLRRFRLPENAKLGQVKADLEKGVLTVTVAKKEAEVMPIPISENPRRKLTKLE